MPSTREFVQALASWFLVLAPGYLGFAVRALLWMAAFMAVTASLAGSARTLGLLGLAAAVLGTAVHMVDSAINVGLASVAEDWSGASAAERMSVARARTAIVSALEGTWASVIAFNHGLPFLLFGAAVSKPQLPDVARVGGDPWRSRLPCDRAAHVLGIDAVGVYVPFAVLVSLFMAALGVLLWRASGASTPGSPAMV